METGNQNLKKIAHQLPGTHWEKEDHTRYYLDLPKLWETIENEKISNSFGRDLNSIKVWIDLKDRNHPTLHGKAGHVRNSAKHFAQTIIDEISAIIKGETPDPLNFDLDLPPEEG